MSASDETTDLFLALSPDRVLDAVEAGGLDVTPACFALNSYENRVYLVTLGDGGRVIAKFYRPQRWSEAQIAEEHRFLEDLAQAEIPVCRVLPFPDGTTHKVTHGITYALFEYKPGQPLGDLSDPLLQRIGMMAARIHNIGASARFGARRTLSAADWVRRPAASDALAALLPATYLRRLRDAAARIADAADQRLTGLTPLRLHGDFHRGNLLLHDGTLQVLDLDDACTGPAVQDLWLMLAGTPASRERQLRVMLAGYEHFRAFDRRELAALDVLPAMRRIHYAAWIARRWHDPIFPVTWPDYGEAAFWAREVADLEAIAAELRGGPSRSHTSNDDPSVPALATADGRDAWREDLTQGDYFWDLED